MQIKELQSLLENFDPESELAVTVKSIDEEREIATTYDIGVDKNEHEELVLKIQI